MSGKTGSEAEMCARFADLARGQGWTVYPELEDWDLVLVARKHGGVQVGVQAKRHQNWRVLYQAMRGLMAPHPVLRQGVGPDYRAVLVPDADTDFEKLGRHLGLAVWSLEHWIRNPKYYAAESAVLHLDGEDFKPSARLWIPDVVPDLPAGVPSPRTLSRWRQGALRLCARLRAGEVLHSDDFKALGVAMQRWRNACWIRADGWDVVDGKRRMRYVLGPRADSKDMPDVGFERERDALAALDAGKGRG